MAKWRDFNASNETDTCLWCGLKLRQGTGTYIDTPEGRKFDLHAKKDKKGDYADGFFCGLRCSYLFAVAWAGMGKRFEPKPQ